MAGDESEPLAAEGPSPFVLLNGRVINVETKEEVGRVDDKHDASDVRRTLSSDGKVFAVSHKAEDGSHRIEIVSVSKGNTVHTLTWETPAEVLQEYGKARGVDKVKQSPKEVRFLRFIGPRRLLAIWEVSIGGGQYLEIYDVVKGTSERRSRKFPVYVGDILALSADGKLVFARKIYELILVDTTSGEITAVCDIPTEGPTPGTPFSSIFLEGVHFSPDGQEVVGLSYDHRVIVWNLAGRIVLDEKVFSKLKAGGDEGMISLPDGSGWLLKGQYLVDRNSRIIVSEIRCDPSGESFSKFLDRGRLIKLRGKGDTRELVVFQLPWEIVEPSLAAIARGDAAVLKPGDSVTLSVNVGPVQHADPQAVAKTIQDELTTLLADGRIQVADGQSCVLQVTYAEKAGETRDVVESGPFGVGVGKTVGNLQDTVGALDLQLTKDGKPVPGWKFHYDSGRSYSISGDLTNTNLREQMFRLVMYIVTKQGFPFYIPTDEKLVELPVISDID